MKAVAKTGRKMAIALWVGKSFVHGMFSGLGTLAIYVVAAVIIINSEGFENLKNAFGLRFGRGDFAKKEGEEGGEPAPVTW